MSELNAQTRPTNCPHCQVGALKQKYLTYFTWLNHELITVPDFPSWVCDFCGHREYDGKALNQLDHLLRPANYVRKVELPSPHQENDNAVLNSRAGID